jgi:hypothetical protein
VTPFDPSALLAVLLAFYPVVSAATLARARTERPEYFASGTLGGSKGDKLVLQDGRVFDLIAAAGGPPSGRHWQVIDVTNDPGGAADPFALEDGPLTLLDEATFVPPPSGASFVGLVAGELAALDGADAVLHGAAAAVAEFDGAADLEDAGASLLDPAAVSHANTRAALDHDDPAEELESAGLTRDEIDARLSEYDEPLPEAAPEDDPGGPPRDDPDPRPRDGKD